MDYQQQDEDLAKADLRNFERLKSERGPWESLWRDIDEMFPSGAGGFNHESPGHVRTEDIFDTTHITAHQKFKAAMVSITVPENQQYIRPRFANPDLMKLRNVQLWCERAGQRLYDIRYAATAGFGTCADEDFDQLGRYGTSPVWQDAIDGRGLTYRTLHLSECYIDTDAVGLVDTVFRCFEKTARECEQLFGRDALTPRMIKALEKPGREHDKFMLLHIVTPNTEYDQDKMDWRSMPIASRYMAIDEKTYLRRSGYHTMPISVSRHMTSPNEKYGRSPAISQLPTIQGVNAMRHTTLRAGHKAVDPALLFYDDDAITSLSSKPGGMNAGLVDEQGRLLLHRMPGGENGIPYAEAMIEQERMAIRSDFLYDFYKILSDPNSRMTTTEVLEVMSKQGVLVRPYANRYRMEKQVPMCNRDLDLALRAEQIDPLPPEVQEAGAWPVIDYENPLAAMARAEETSKTLRFMQVLPQLAELDENVRNRVDVDAMTIGIAQEMGVKPSYLRTDEDVEALAQGDAEAQQAGVDAELLEKSAGASLDLARANQLAAA